MMDPDPDFKNYIFIILVDLYACLSRFFWYPDPDQGFLMRIRIRANDTDPTGSGSETLLLSVQYTVGKYETGFIPTNSGNGGRVRAARGELDVLRGRLSLHEGTQQHKLFLNIIQFSI